MNGTYPRRLAMTALTALLLTAGSLGGCSADAPVGVNVPEVPWNGSGETDRDAGDEFPPPGVEVEAFELTAPTASLNYVWIANTTRGTVAKVAADSGVVRISTVRVGAEPTVIVTDPSDDLAVVLNSGSDTVSVVRAGAPGEDDSVVTVDIVADANRLSLSPDATVAFAWYDNRAAEIGDRPGSLTEVSAITVAAAEPQVFQLSVGVNVRDVVYTATGEGAFILSDDGVSRITLADLDSDRFVPPVPIAATGEDIPVGEDREIIVAESADVALVRLGERSSLRIVDLGSGAISDVPLAAPPTDLDLVPGAAFAILSLREREEIGIADLDALRDGDADAIEWLALEGQTAGQSVLSPVGNDLLVFSTVAESERLSVVDLTTLDVRTFNLRKGVRGAVVSPDGSTAIVYHTKAPGEPVAGEPEEDIIAKSHAFTALSIESGITKLVRTDAEPGEMTFDATGSNAFVLTADEARGTRALEWIDLRTLRTTHIDFDRTPEHVGVVPGAGLIYVSQIHDLGRIAFLDVATGELREITGFELNGLIE